jgi:Na+/proline symporter
VAPQTSLAIESPTSIFGLHPIDLGVLGAYLVGVTALGIAMARYVRSTSDFFMPRRFGKAMMITNAFGTGTASDQAVAIAAETFRSGLSGIWWQWVWLPATPFYWLIAPILRRLRAVTMADAYALRFDRGVAGLFAVVGFANLAVKIGLLLKGAGELCEASTAGAIPARLAMGVITVLFVLYGTAGGLAAAIVTDFFQGLLTIAFSVMLLPFVLQAVGGLSGVRETIDDPALLSLVVPGEIGVFFVAMYSLQLLIGIVAQPFVMGVCAAGRTEMDGRVGFMVGNLVKRFCTMAWSLTAMGALAWYLQRGVDLSSVKPDHVYGDVARAFLPQTMPGLLGLFLAALLASIMSSCDAYMISASGLFTQNIYRQVAPDRSEDHYLAVGRTAGLAIVASGLWFAYRVDSVKSALDVWFRIAPMMGIAFWMGLFWRRTTVAGAWAATLTGFFTWWICTHDWLIGWIEGLPWAAPLGLIAYADGRPEIYSPWIILCYTLAALAAGTFVSLVTPPVPAARLDAFYQLTRTPVTQGEVLLRSCALPEGVAPQPRKMLCTALGLEIPRPSTVSMLGFAAGWAAVIALVGGFVWLVR